MKSRLHSRVIIAGLCFSFAVVVFAFQNCQSSTFSTTQSQSLPSSSDTVAGNPMTAQFVAENIAQSLCQKISSCAPTSQPVSYYDCYANIQTLSNIVPALGAQASAYPRFADLINADLAGTILGNTSAANSCSGSISSMRCDSASVQSVYGSSGPQYSNSASLLGSSCASSFSSTFWVYYNGVYNWKNDWSASASADYQDTSGNPIEGPYDMKITITANSFGLWQPVADANCVSDHSVCFDVSPYSNFVFSLKPTQTNAVFAVQFTGSNDANNGNRISDVSQYCSGGSNPPVNQWETCSIPLSVLGMTDPLVEKFFIQDQSNEPTFYLDNVGFTGN